MVIIIIFILAFSVIIHEVSHGLAAYKFGDDTAYVLGRITLNPLRHIDIVGTLIVPVACYMLGLPPFGWAKPVPVNPMRFKDPKREMGLTALAGPVSNITLALVVYLAYLIFSRTTGVSITTGFLFAYAVFLNLFLAMFNLLPIPPLDGSKVVAMFISYETAFKYMRYERYGMLMVMAFIFLGGAQVILLPLVLFFMGDLGRYLL